jgi:hypothetical protein
MSEDDKLMGQVIQIVEARFGIISANGSWDG